MAGGSEVFYTQSGFGNLLNSVVAHNNPNENYYFVVNPPVGNKSGVRPAAVYQQFAKAPNIHPVVEFNKAAWNKLPGGWLTKGREFRQEMINAGLPANTPWALNELGSGMRAPASVQRRQMEALLQGISNFGQDKGFVFQQGPGYAKGLPNEMKDNTFWKIMKQDSRSFMPETYAGPNRFLKMSKQQQKNFLFGADKGPNSGPLLNAFVGNKAYGTQKVTPLEMKRFVEAQLAQVHGNHASTFGVSWNDHPSGMSPAQLAVLANLIAAGK